MKNLLSSAPKKGSNKVLMGVCSGLAEHLQIDPFWVRLGFGILIPITGGFIILIYLILAVAMENEEAN